MIAAGGFGVGFELGGNLDQTVAFFGEAIGEVDVANFVGDGFAGDREVRNSGDFAEDAAKAFAFDGLGGKLDGHARLDFFTFSDGEIANTSEVFAGVFDFDRG